MGTFDVWGRLSKRMRRAMDMAGLRAGYCKAVAEDGGTRCVATTVDGDLDRRCWSGILVDG